MDKQGDAAANGAVSTVQLWKIKLELVTAALWSGIRAAPAALTRALVLRYHPLIQS